MSRSVCICTEKRPRWRARRDTIPGVRLAAATLHLLTLGRENNAEETQVIEELQRPILGQRECAFFLKASPAPGRDGSLHGTVTNCMF